jgi:hypothetical protein
VINNVPIKIMEASRIVTLRHPNSLDCGVYRKTLLRPPEGPLMGGLSTLGGLGVLKNEDDPDFEYVLLGPGKLHITSRFDGGEMFDRGDGIASDEPMQEANIVSVKVPGFEPKKGDLVAAMPGGGVVIGFEIIGTTGNVSIYPYTTKFVIAPRDELHDLAPWTPAP